MTIQELINKLQEVEDKTAPLKVWDSTIHKYVDYLGIAKVPAGICLEYDFYLMISCWTSEEANLTLSK